MNPNWNCFLKTFMLYWNIASRENYKVVWAASKISFFENCTKERSRIEARSEENPNCWREHVQNLLYWNQIEDIADRLKILQIVWRLQPLTFEYADKLKQIFQHSELKKKQFNTFSELVPVQIFILAFCVFASFLVLTIVSLVSIKYCWIKK